MTTDEEKGVSQMEEFINTPQTFIMDLHGACVCVCGGGDEMWVFVT